MTSEFIERHGLAIPLPEEWEFEETSDDEKYTASLSGTDTSFWTVSIFFDAPDATDVVRHAVEALESEYEAFESHTVEELVCERESVAVDAKFECLEWTATACLRGFRFEESTVLVYFQGTDDELQDTRAILDGLTQLLRIA